MVGGIGQSLLENDLVGVLDGLAQEDHEIGFADGPQGFQVVVQALGNSDGSKLAGHFAAGFAAHSIRNHEQASRAGPDHARKARG